MNTNLEFYKVFYYVVKRKSITKAANELMVSQPAVSKSIKTLEEQLNTTLLVRKSNGVELTYAGEIVYNKIKKAMELIDSAEEDLNNLNNMEYGTINIGAGNTIMQKYLMNIINQFHNLYPHINVKVHTLDTGELIKRAQLGLIDIVFTHFPNEYPNTFEAHKIKTLHDILVVNKDSIYLDKVIKKSDLENMPLILLPHGASGRNGFDNFCILNNISLHPLMEVGNDIVIEECAQSGLGVGLVTKEYVEKELEKGLLIALNTKFSFDERHLGYLIEPNKKNNIIIKNFINLLK